MQVYSTDYSRISKEDIILQPRSEARLHLLTPGGSTFVRESPFPFGVAPPQDPGAAIMFKIVDHQYCP